MSNATYVDRREELRTYFDRTAVEAWRRLTSNEPVGRIRATVRAGRNEMRGTLTGMAQMFPTREPSSMKTVDASVVRDEDSVATSITLEYEFAPVAITVSGRADFMPSSWGMYHPTIWDIATLAGTIGAPVARAIAIVRLA